MAQRPLCSQRVPFSGSDRPMSMCSALTPYRYLRIVPCWRPLASARKVAKGQECLLVGRHWQEAIVMAELEEIYAGHAQRPCV